MSKYVEIQVPKVTRIMLPTGTEIHAYRNDLLVMMVSIEDGKYHLAISHPHRYPSWNEIKEARYELIPDNLTMAMLLPPKLQYVNVHKNCFHLWEL